MNKAEMISGLKELLKEIDYLTDENKVNECFIKIGLPSIRNKMETARKLMDVPESESK